MISNIAFGLFGLATLVSVGYLMSGNKKAIDWRQIAAGVSLQIVFAVIVILVPGGREFFNFISTIFVKVIDFALAGSQFIFGDLANASEFGFIFAFQVLPHHYFLCLPDGCALSPRHHAKDRSGHGLGDAKNIARQWF